MNKQVFRQILKKQKITQKQLAAEINMDEMSMSRKINGKRAFTVPEMISICMALKLQNPVPIFAPELQLLKEPDAGTSSSVW